MHEKSIVIFFFFSISLLHVMATKGWHAILSHCDIFPCIALVSQNLVKGF